MTTDALQRAKRDLEVSLALSFPGSPVRDTILTHMTAIDAEMNRRSGWDLAAKVVPEGSPRWREAEGITGLVLQP